jgi:hypothetical protein
VLEAANDLIELLVGLACIGLAWPAWRRGGGMRVVAVLFAVAGIAAVAHAAARVAQ